MKEVKEEAYFADSHYNPNKHWHIDTWVDENTPYFEAICFERLVDGSWDVFFDQFQDKTEMHNVCGKKLNYIKGFGVFLYNASEREVEAQFRIWVNERLLKYRRTSKK